MMLRGAPSANAGGRMNFGASTGVFLAMPGIGIGSHAGPVGSVLPATRYTLARANNQAKKAPIVPMT